MLHTTHLCAVAAILLACVGAAGSAVAHTGHVCVNTPFIVDQSTSDIIESGGIASDDNDVLYNLWTEDLTRIVKVRRYVGGIADPIVTLDTDVYGSEAAICSTPSGKVHAVWTKYPSLFVSNSFDHGVTWTPPVQIPATPTIYYSPIGGAFSIQCDGEENVRVFWMQNESGRKTIFSNFSQDGGATWKAAPFQVSAGDYGVTASQFSDAMTGSGQVYVAWGTEPISDYPYSDILLNRSLDGGATWESTDQVLYSGGANAVGWPVIATGPGGAVYAVWSRSVGQLFHVFASASPDNGATWSDPIDIGGGPADYPGLGVDSATGIAGVVYAQQDLDGSVSLYLHRSLDSGASWEPSVRLGPISNDGSWAIGATGGPYLNFLPGGTVLALWKARDAQVPGREYLRANASTDGGVTWDADSVALDSNNTGALFGTVMTVDPDGTAYVVPEAFITPHRQVDSFYACNLKPGDAQ